MTPVLTPRLAAFRSRHRINAVRDYDDDLRRSVWRCVTDGLRLYQVRGGSWRHDVGELTDAERGR